MTHARVRFLSVVLLLVAPLRGAAADLTETFLARYREAAARAASRYSENRAARATIRLWHSGDRTTGPPELYSTTRVHAHTSGPAGRIDVEETFHQSDSARRTGVLLWSADEAFELRPGADGRGHVIRWHGRRDERPAQHEGFRMLAPQMLPQLYDEGKSVLGTFDNLGKGPTWPASVEVLAAEPATWKGAACTAVRFRETFQLRKGEKGVPVAAEKTVYFDDRNDWITLAILYPTEPPPKDADPAAWAKSSVLEVEYAPGPDDYPLPTKSARYAVMLDGSVRFDERVEVHEFERYTPRPGEFSPEAYGLTRPAEARVAPAGEVPPAPARLWSVWVLAGVTAAVLAGWLFWRWRVGVKKGSTQLPGDASEGSAGW